MASVSNHGRPGAAAEWCWHRAVSPRQPAWALGTARLARVEEGGSPVPLHSRRDVDVSRRCGLQGPHHHGGLSSAQGLGSLHSDPAASVGGGRAAAHGTGRSYPGSARLCSGFDQEGNLQTWCRAPGRWPQDASTRKGEDQGLGPYFPSEAQPPSPGPCVHTHVYVCRHIRPYMWAKRGPGTPRAAPPPQAPTMPVVL